MAVDLATRAEIIKLARDLSTDPVQLQYLAGADASAVAELRRAIEVARFSRLRPQLLRLAGTVNLLPTAVTARIAKATIGPALSGRVASVLPLATAIKFVAHYDAAYLAQIAPTLEPDSGSAIIASVAPDLAVEVAVELMRAAEFPTLGRLLSVVSRPVVDGLIAQANPVQLLLLAYFADDHQLLDEILAAQADAVLAEVVVAAQPRYLIELVSVIRFVRPVTANRFISAAKAATVFTSLSATARELGVRLPRGAQSRAG
jgi:hypothetical protein